MSGAIDSPSESSHPQYCPCEGQLLLAVTGPYTTSSGLASADGSNPLLVIDRWQLGALQCLAMFCSVPSIRHRGYITKHALL